MTHWTQTSHCLNAAFYLSIAADHVHLYNASVTKLKSSSNWSNEQDNDFNVVTLVEHLWDVVEQMIVKNYLMQSCQRGPESQEWLSIFAVWAGQSMIFFFFPPCPGLCNQRVWHWNRRHWLSETWPSGMWQQTWLNVCDMSPGYVNKKLFENTTLPYHHSTL